MNGKCCKYTEYKLNTVRKTLLQIIVNISTNYNESHYSIKHRLQCLGNTVY